jgi:asparagine synthase (glutamine-hydrolysing)
MPNLLSNDILWRSKEAFSDGVSGDDGAWFKIISNKLNDISLTPHEETITHMLPTSKEQLYYRSLFDGLYPYGNTTIPHFWMPKYIHASDPSARLMDDYTER